MYKIQEAFEFFLGIKGEIEDFKAESPKDISFNIAFSEKPLGDFVEIPEYLRGLQYNNIICGAVRGAINSVLAFFFFIFLELFLLFFLVVTYWKSIYEK